MNLTSASTRLYPEGTPVSYWLLPATPDRELLKKSIDALAGELDAPLFDPHITLFSTSLVAGEDPSAILTKVARAFNPLRLTCGATGHSGMLFKTLFIEFSYEAVSPIANAIRDRCRYQSSYRLEPHLSLLYGSLPQPTRHLLSERIKFVGKAIRFSHIAAIVPGSGETDFQNVGRWQTCAIEALSTPVNVQGNQPSR